MPGLSVRRARLRPTSPTASSPSARSSVTQGIGAHGITWPVDDLYDELLRERPTVSFGGRTLPVRRDRAGRCQRHPAPRARDERRVGLPGLRRRGEEGRAAAHRPRRRERADVRTTFADLAAQPRRVLTTRPCWTGIIERRAHLLRLRLNVERLVPWRTLTGRAALLPRSPRLHRLRRGAPHLQAASSTPALRPGSRRVRRRPGPEPAAQLPDPARQVGHPLHLRRQPPDADALARDPPALAERPGRRRDRPPATTTGSRS